MPKQLFYFLTDDFFYLTNSWCGLWRPLERSYCIQHTQALETYPTSKLIHNLASRPINFGNIKSSASSLVIRQYRCVQGAPSFPKVKASIPPRADDPRCVSRYFCCLTNAESYFSPSHILSRTCDVFWELPFDARSRKTIFIDMRVSISLRAAVARSFPWWI